MPLVVGVVSAAIIVVTIALPMPLVRLFVNYRLSIENYSGSVLVLSVSIVQIVGILAIHTSLFDVVMVQLRGMLGLLVVLLMWDFSLAKLLPCHL